MAPAANQESIGFLIGALLRRKGLAFRALLAPYEVTPRQYAVLSSLWQTDCLALTDLANRLYADPSSLSRTLVLMEKSGLIQRRRDDEDRRVYRFMLAQRGRALGRRLRPLVQTHEAAAVRGLSAKEIEVTANAMRKMLENLSDAAAAGDFAFDDDEA